MAKPSSRWLVDPDDPRAPPREVWARLSEEERALVVAELPSDFPPNEANPPEGDRHYETYSNARETLSRWFRQQGRPVYISGNLPVYYPGEAMFSPDVIAVLDVEPHQRDSWIVSREGDRGLDFALEVIVSGRRRKDLQVNVTRYAELGIAEYFVFDRSRAVLHGYRLPEPAPARGVYERLLPQGGRYRSSVLGLELSVDGGGLRFSAGDAALPNAAELLTQLGDLVSEADQRAAALEAALEEEQKRREDEQKRREDEQKRREDEQKRREDEQKRREEAEAEVARLRAELEALRRRG